MLLLVCLATGAACLALGYASVGLWPAIAAPLLTLGIWLLAYKRPSSCPPSIALAISVGGAALGVVGTAGSAVAEAGVLAGSTSLLMLLAVILALAGWDLMLFDQGLAGSSGSLAQTVTLFEQRHFASLALALGLGLLLVVAGRMIHLQIPFVGMTIVALIALFGLERVWHTLMN